jgi:predicted RNA binding protein YcfA (HicA-like mRNA interferase family)
MTNKYPILRPNEIISALSKKGFVYKSQKGSHAKYSNGHHTIIIPMHDTIARETLKSILIQANIEIRNFFKIIIVKISCMEQFFLKLNIILLSCGNRWNVMIYF